MKTNARFPKVDEFSIIVNVSTWVSLSFIITFLAFSEVGGYEALIDKYFAAVADDRFLILF